MSFFKPTLNLSFKVAAEDEISLLTRVSTPSKATHKTWSFQAAELEESGNQGGDKEVEIPGVRFMPLEGGIPSPQLQCFEDSSPTVPVDGTPSDAAQPRLNLSLDASLMSVRSTDTTLEYFDAPLSGEEDGVSPPKDEDAVTVNLTAQAEMGEPETTSAASEDIPPMREEVEEAKEEEESEVVETGLEQETTNEETVPPVPSDERDPDLGTKQDASLADQGNASEENSPLWYPEAGKHEPDPFHLEAVCKQTAEDADATSGVSLEDAPVTTATQDVLAETTEATAFLQHLNSSEAAEPANEEKLDQTGPSLLKR